MDQEKLYPLSEALKRLEEEIGSTWEPHHFYEAVLKNCKGLMLKAAPPLQAEVRMFGHRPGIDRGMVCKTKSFGWGMALLYEQQVQQLQMRGEASVIHAEEVAKNPQPHFNDEFWFTKPGTESPEPVRITSDDVLVVEHVLQTVIAVARSDSTKHGECKPKPKADPEAQNKPIPRASAQDAEILGAIKKRGLDPLRLPRPEQGKAGVKAEIRRELTEKRRDVFVSISVFDVAWQRLRNQGQICDV